MMKKRLIVGISGASCAELGILLLKEMVFFPDWETHLVVTRGGVETLRLETGMDMEEVAKLADFSYAPGNLAAPPASGSFLAEAMVVVPCSMKTLAGIACGYSDNLLLRAADVTLKERRRLVLVARESPLSLVHLDNMRKACIMGAVILPPVLSMYAMPASIHDLLRHCLGKILQSVGLEMPGFVRWDGKQKELT